VRATVSAGGAEPDALQQVMLPLIDNEVCNQPSWHNNSLDDSMVCAGYEEGRLGNCHVSFRSTGLDVLQISVDVDDDLPFPSGGFRRGRAGSGPPFGRQTDAVTHGLVS